MKSTKQAIENMEYVQRLLEQKQPEFAASLEFAVSLAETSMEKPMDDELIRLCAERLHSKVVGWLPRHVRPRDVTTVGPPPVTAGSFRCCAFTRGLPACSWQVTIGSTQWRGSGRSGLAAITLTRAWA